MISDNVFLSVHHELVHGRSQERHDRVWGKEGQSRIYGGSKRGGVTIESNGKLEISYINVDNF
jgi:hypothetical protein